MRGTGRDAAWCTAGPWKPRYVSGIELILCTLHAGGKFNGGNYKVSGGLHGVGSSVVNALSSELTATVRREGVEYRQNFGRGVPADKLKKLGPTRARGTSIHFRPDIYHLDDTGFVTGQPRPRGEY